MKLIPLLPFLSFCLCTHAQDNWIQKDSLNGSPRSSASAFILDGEAYTLGGLDENGFRRKMYSYTYSQDDWDKEESIGGPSGSGLGRGSACAFSIESKAYVVGGQGETSLYLADTWEYDLATKVWTQRADFGGGPRKQSVCFVYDGSAYMGLGNSPTGLRKDMYRYNNITNVWTQINDFGGTARKEAVGFLMGGRAYVGTGDDGILRNDFWEYNPVSDTWNQKADFPGTARKGAVGWGIFPEGFICTGEDLNYDFKKDLWQYNYFTDSWQQKADFMGTGRTNAIAFVLEGLAFVGTGYDGIFYDDLYAYSPVLSTPEGSFDAAVTVFPNPVEETFTVQCELNDLTLRLLSSDGRELTDRCTISNTSTAIFVQRNGVPAGTYFLEIVDNATSTRISKNVIFK